MPTGGYYAPAKKGGKQFRRLLTTRPWKLAERRRNELKDQFRQLSVADDFSIANLQ